MGFSGLANLSKRSYMSYNICLHMRRRQLYSPFLYTSVGRLWWKKICKKWKFFSTFGEGMKFNLDKK
jgi:hypothetical protein